MKFDDKNTYIKQKITEFNWQHWSNVERLPLGLKLNNAQGKLIAGLSGRSFGNWLLIDNLWVDSNLRDKGIGAQLLNEAETIAVKCGCNQVLLDTLEFQAKPFYEALGYQVKWTQ